MQRNIQRAAANIKDKHVFWCMEINRQTDFSVLYPIDDVIDHGFRLCQKHFLICVQAAELGGAQRRLPLCGIEAGRNGNDGILDLLAFLPLHIAANVLQNSRGDLLRFLVGILCLPAGNMHLTFAHL